MDSMLPFHFLRPLWLLALLPAVLIAWSAWQRRDPMRTWQGLMDAELLDALLLRSTRQRSWLRPAWLLAAAGVVAILAMAGPSWDRQPAPFAEDQAAVFVVMKVTPEMLAQDIAPSRLQRAVQKVHDLLELRPGQRTGLIAYAGTAHLVMPLTSDANIIETFAAALTPDAMPIDGDNPAAAIALANERLLKADVAGSIVLIADRVESSQFEALAQQRRAGGAPVHMLAVAGGPERIPPPGSPPAAPLDQALMQDASRAAGGSLTLLSADRADVKRLAAKVTSDVRDAPGDERLQWLDRGYWLLPLLALLMLPLFRPGGAVVLE